jgi:uncharacterized protein YndB with AHSA1/START domain
MYEFRLERLFDASPELTFDEMLDPKAQLEWWGGDGEIVRATCDLRVGGTATIEWGPSEAALIRTDQVFREIERPHRLVYAETVRQAGFPIYECLLTFALVPIGDKTRLTLHHTGFPTLEQRDLHQRGTGIFFDRLAAHLGRATKRRRA